MLSTLASTHSSPRQDCTPITAVITQSAPSPYACLSVCVRACVCECAPVLAEGSFSVTAIAGIVAEQVSTQLSWVRPAVAHGGRLFKPSRLLSSIVTKTLTA